MSAPALTTTQIFQNSINRVVQNMGGSLNGNSPQSFIGIYNNWYSQLFSNPNGDSAAVVTQLGTSAANTFATLAALSTFLVSCGLTGLSAIPAYTANNDGTVILIN
jgi:hypothetical protein